MAFDVQSFADSNINLESLTQANFIARLKHEQIRMLIRIHTFRETSFVSSGYAIAEAIAFSYLDFKNPELVLVNETRIFRL